MKMMLTIISHGFQEGVVPTAACGFAKESGRDSTLGLAEMSDGELAFFNCFSTSIALCGRWIGSFAKQAATVSSQFFGIASPFIPSAALRSLIEGGIVPLTWTPISPT